MFCALLSFILPILSWERLPLLKKNAWRYLAKLIGFPAVSKQFSHSLQARPVIPCPAVKSPTVNSLSTVIWSAERWVGRRLMSKEKNPPTACKYIFKTLPPFVINDSIIYHYWIARRVKRMIIVGHSGINRNVPCPVSHRNRRTQKERSEATAAVGMESAN